MTVSGIENRYRIKIDQVKIWMERYNRRDVDELKHSSKNNQYSLEFKQTVAKEYLAEGTSYPEFVNTAGYDQKKILYAFTYDNRNLRSLTWGDPSEWKDGISYFSFISKQTAEPFEAKDEWSEGENTI
ncbi:hypothetical protein LRA02_12690 [Lentilactobacillus rapi]|uniref:Transposase n=2 Tax=Lentilactobacillus rapi TaxID=481723 RepID=A0A512PMH6_9LACO|nr:hypothetical protein [Lentilactobacillus rapi]GEP72401.1 hypothetical protein LRA02_12690 [Lentilactobacillus rapi]